MLPERMLKILPSILPEKRTAWAQVEIALSRGAKKHPYRIGDDSK